MEKRKLTASVVNEQLVRRILDNWANVGLVDCSRCSVTVTSPLCQAGSVKQASMNAAR